MSSGPPTPQQADPFAPSYLHPSGQTTPSFPSTDSSIQPSSAQPSHSSGQAPHDQVPFGHSSFGQPSFGPPQDNQPSFGQSTASQPASMQPSHGQSWHGQPNPGQSSFGQPLYGQPPSGPPSFGQSSYGQAPPMSQQHTASGMGGATHNPFAAAGGAGGSSSFGNAGVPHVTLQHSSHDSSLGHTSCVLIPFTHNDMGTTSWFLLSSTVA